AIPGGCTPDTISSDIHVFSGNSSGVPYLPNVMSKFITLGFTLEQVVAMATSAPAKIINRAPKIGTLQIGAPGDVAIMELVEGQTTFVDTRNNKREGKLLLKPVQTTAVPGPAKPGGSLPLAVSPDKKRLFAGLRNEPYSVVTFAIDAKTGKLKPIGPGPLADSMAYISTDRTGKFLFSASYGGN